MESRGCAFKLSAECFSFPLIELTPELARIGPDQMAKLGLIPQQKLFYCSECSNVWIDAGHHHALPIGRIEAMGGIFKPDVVKRYAKYWDS